jgi:hypothetical protein
LIEPVLDFGEYKRTFLKNLSEVLSLYVLENDVGTGLSAKSLSVSLLSSDPQGIESLYRNVAPENGISPFADLPKSARADFLLVNFISWFRHSFLLNRG